MLAILFGVLFAQAPPQQPAPVPDATRLRLSAPTVVAEVETSKVQGDPVGLAWNTDGTVYLRVLQGKDKARHYLIATVPALSVAQCDQLPAWAAEYWAWKSSTSAPGDPTFKLDVEQRREPKRIVNTPGGGDLAGTTSAALPGSSGGEGVSQAAAVSAAMNTTMSTVIAMRYKGQVVGEWVDAPPQPGMRFGWAPAPMGLLAYVGDDGRLMLLDRQGKKVPVPGATKTLLPAWSLDGTQIVYLQQKTSKTYLLMVATVR
jgi:hypothetical protein